MAKKLTRILSIDGGGIRGVLPGQILVALEKKLEKRLGKETKIAQHFDFLAGTSTGGILTCILLVPDELNPNKPKYSAQEAVDLYLKNGGEIFDIPMFHKLRTADGILDERYPSNPIETVLKDYLQDLKLSQLVKPCLLTAYDVRRGKPHFFTQHDARKSVKSGSKSHEFYVRDVARATSAAPTFFEAAKVISFSGVEYPLVDGGVFANNPSLCAYAEARKLAFNEHKHKPSAAEMLIVSIGTGSQGKSYDYKKVKNWGMIQWVKPIIEIMMNGVSQTVDYELKQIYDAVSSHQQYMRIDPILGDAKSDMDNASETNLKALEAAGVESAEKYDKELERVADLLLANA